MQFVKVCMGTYYNFDCIEEILVPTYGKGIVVSIRNHGSIKLNMGAEDFMLALNTDKVLVDLSQYFME